jgi:hypothetical protein
MLLRKQLGNNFVFLQKKIMDKYLNIAHSLKSCRHNIEIKTKTVEIDDKKLIIDGQYLGDITCISKEIDETYFTINFIQKSILHEGGISRQIVIKK